MGFEGDHPLHLPLVEDPLSQPIPQSRQPQRARYIEGKVSQTAPEGEQ
jgi:hypothetical protein